jgi:hypothetical protein
MLSAAPGSGATDPETDSFKKPTSPVVMSEGREKPVYFDDDNPVFDDEEGFKTTSETQSTQEAEANKDGDKSEKSSKADQKREGTSAPVEEGKKQTAKTSRRKKRKSEESEEAEAPDSQSKKQKKRRSSIPKQIVLNRTKISPLGTASKKAKRRSSRKEIDEFDFVDDSENLRNVQSKKARTSSAKGKADGKKASTKGASKAKASGTARPSRARRR